MVIRALAKAIRENGVGYWAEVHLQTPEYYDYISPSTSEIVQTVKLKHPRGIYGTSKVVNLRFTFDGRAEQAGSTSAHTFYYKIVIRDDYGHSWESAESYISNNNYQTRSVDMSNLWPLRGDIYVQLWGRNGSSSTGMDTWTRNIIVLPLIEG